MKKYQVIMQDEWNNLYCLGFFNKLNEAIPEINSWLSVYEIDPLKDNDLQEYASTFSPSFDKELWDKEEETCIYVRGFIFEDIEKEINNE